MDDATTKSIQANEPVVTESEVKQMRKRIRELERMLGHQTMRAETLEETSEICGLKNRSCPEARPALQVVVGWSCKRQGFCPLPWALRYAMVYNRKLCLGLPLDGADSQLGLPVGAVHATPIPPIMSAGGVGSARCGVDA